MKTLVDVNVWLALLVERHVHNDLARDWFEDLAVNQAGMCRFVQLALIRLLGNPTAMSGQALAPGQAWSVITALLADERVQLVPEPPDLETAFARLLLYPVPTGKLIGDAYLAAFALTSSRRMVTFDRGFQQFGGLDLELLGA